MFELTIKIPAAIEFFIEQLIKTQNLKVGAELGVWKGRTFKHLVKTCDSLTLFGVDAYVTQPDNSGPETWQPGENGHDWNHDEYYEDLLAFTSQYKNRAFIIKSFTTIASTFFADESLDFVFIDADHSFDGVKNDILNWSPKIRKGGFIIGHDIDWEPVKKAVSFCLEDIMFGPDNVWFTVKK